VTSVQIFNGIRDLEGNPYPYALVLVMLIVTAALFLLSRLFLIGGTALGGGRAVQSRVLVDPRKTRALLISGAFLGVSLVALGPHFGVLLLAFASDWYGSVLPETLTLRHFNAALGNDLTLSSLANSLRYASASTLIDLGLGTTVAFVLIRSKASGRALLDGLMMLPLAVPGIVLALGYLALAREGQPFHVLIVGGDPFWLLVIAYAVRRLPYVVRAMTAGLQQISVTYEEAALSLGAGPARVFGRVTLPLLVPALLTGGTLAFAFAMLDVSDSMILAQRTVHFPITKAIYSLAGTIGEGPALAAALGVWSMVFLTALLPGLSLVIGSGSRRGLSRS
jgi:iron(III) transport system permease protein